MTDQVRGFQFIKLERFRGYREATIQLGDLTLILGPNSAGKSSFGHALVALSRVHRHKSAEPRLDPEDKRRTEGWIFPFDLGRRENLLHDAAGEDDDVRITCGVLDQEVGFGFGGRGSAGLPLTWVQLRSLGDLRVPQQHEAPPASNPEGAASGLVASEAASEFVSEPLAEMEPRFLERFENRGWRMNGGPAVGPSWSGLRVERMVGSADYHPGSAIEFDPKFHSLALELLSGIVYLRPDREPPHRWSPLEEVDTVGDRGESTAAFLHGHGAQKVELVLRNGFGAGRPDLPDPELWRFGEPTSVPLQEAVSKWMNELQISSTVLTTQSGDGRDVGVRASVSSQSRSRAMNDIGFGVSQALPIVVQGLALGAASTFVIEQPEAQLHPRAQAGLASFLCSLVKLGRRVIVETHSEVIFHRIRLHATLDEDLAARTAVWFVGEGEHGECCQPTRIVLSAEGEIQWPRGFFAENVDSEILIQKARRDRAAGTAGKAR